MSERWLLEGRTRIGDIILSRPKGEAWPVIGWIIEGFQRGRYSHAIIKIGPNQWFSQQPSKPKIITAAQISEDYREILIRRPDGPFSAKDIQDAEAVCGQFLLLGDYDEVEILGRAAAIILGRDKPIFEEAKDYLHSVCSGAVSYILQHGFHAPDPCPDRADNMTTPRDLANSSKMQTVDHGFPAGNGTWKNA